MKYIKIFLIISSFSLLFSMGIEVSPGLMTLEQIPPGLAYNSSEHSGDFLRITNKDDRARCYIISTHRLSDSGPLPAGYNDIPEPSWLSFERDSVWVEAGSTARVIIYLNIPDDEVFYNQAWAAGVSVRARSEAGEMFALAAYPVFKIETQAKTMEISPYGEFAVAPMVINRRVSPGQKLGEGFTLFNNLESKLTCKLEMLDPAEGDIRIPPSASYQEPIPHQWVSFDRKPFKIKPLSSQQIKLGLNLPDNAESGDYEGIICILQNTGVIAFVRLQLAIE